MDVVQRGLGRGGGHMRNKAFLGFLTSAVVFLSACGPTLPGKTPEAGIPNPASVFCEEHGGRLNLRTGPDGGVAGICIFPDGSECEEWAYFRAECKPGDSLITPEAASSPAASESAADGWQIYRDDERGYSFSYPADATIGVNDDPLRSLSIVGPEVDGERWPQITISHPSDRAEYRPPQGVDLAQWLMDNSLLGDKRLPDVTIAGATAIHLRHERSPQSYAYDRYYFAHEGQLYMLIIGHAGDREDWELYNRFLDSFQFDA
jgi:putative hemolysin